MSRTRHEQATTRRLMTAPRADDTTGTGALVVDLAEHETDSGRVFSSVIVGCEHAHRRAQVVVRPSELRVLANALNQAATLIERGRAARNSH